MTTSSNTAVLDLGRQYPEWQPWLTVIEEVLREATDSQVGGVGCRATGVAKKVKFRCWRAPRSPWTLRAVGRWSERLMRAAYRSGAPKMSTLDGVEHKRLNTVDLFKSSLCQNGKWLARGRC